MPMLNADDTQVIQLRHTLQHHRREVDRLTGLLPAVPQRAGQRVIVGGPTTARWSWREDAAEALAWHAVRVSEVTAELVGLGYVP